MAMAKQSVRIAELPVEIWAIIISKLGFEGLCSASLVCKSWGRFASVHKVPRLLRHLHDTIYHHHFMSNPPELRFSHDRMDQVRFSRSLVNHVAFVTFPKTSALSARVYFPQCERAFEWPLPAQLSAMYSSKGFICGLITPEVNGEGFRFIVSSRSITRSSSWEWISLPISASLKFHEKHPHVKFVVSGRGTEEHFYVIIVGDENASEIEVYSSGTGTWKRHLRRTTYRRTGFEGDIAVDVVNGASEMQNDLLALSFNPANETWGCRVPFGGAPPLAISRKPYSFVYAGFGEDMLVAGHGISSLLSEGQILSEKGGASGRSAQKTFISYPDLRVNFSSSGNTGCFQRVVKQKPVLSRCYLNKFDILNLWVDASFTTSDDAFLITCCE